MLSGRLVHGNLLNQLKKRTRSPQFDDLMNRILPEGIDPLTYLFKKVPVMPLSDADNLK
jgi:hypothetical protein